MERELKEEKDNSKKLKIVLVVLLIVVLIVAITIGVICFSAKPQISLSGQKEISVNYPTEYKEPGYKAKTLTNDVTDKVKVTGQVDTTKVGTYKVTYQVKNFWFTDTVTRVVKVVDTEKPVIKLKGSEEVKVCPSKKYKEEGYEVTDNYDTDLKDMVVITNKENEIVYQVKDTSGNEAEVVRKIKYEDKTKPVLKLKGSSSITLNSGSSYKEPGYTATDNCDDNLTSKVKVSGKVDTKKVGTYKITYTVKDKTGNEVKKTRTVTVRHKPVTNSLVSATTGCGTKGVIYLTFDDGPAQGSTAKILDVLKKEGVKATFFVTNSGPDSLIKREYNEGHTVALHTASHNYAKVYASVDAYFADLKKVSDRVKRLTGVEAKNIRFPGGSSNTVSRRYTPKIMTYLSKEVVKRGYKYFDWNIDSDDAVGCTKSKSKNCVYNNVVSALSKNKCNMVLMHDVKSYTADALDDIIKYGKKNGYTFKKITSSTPMVKHGINN